MAVQTDVDGNLVPDESMSGFLDGATNEIRGTVTVEGEPASAMVLCMHRNAMYMGQIAYSNGDGAYRFIGLRGGTRRYMVIATDPFTAAGQQYNAVVADQIEPVPPEE